MVKLTSFCGCEFTFGYYLSEDRHKHSYEHWKVTGVRVLESSNVTKVCNAHKELAIHDIIKEFIQSPKGIGDEELVYEHDKIEASFLIQIRNLLGLETLTETDTLIQNIKKRLTNG